MDIDKLTEQILEITNNSDYGWIDLDSADADRIKVALTQAMNYSHCCKSDSELLQKIEMVKSFKWGIDPTDNERRMCELIKLL